MLDDGVNRLAGEDKAIRDALIPDTRTGGRHLLAVMPDFDSRQQVLSPCAHVFDIEQSASHFTSLDTSDLVDTVRAYIPSLVFFICPHA